MIEKTNNDDELPETERTVAPERQEQKTIAPAPTTPGTIRTFGPTPPDLGIPSPETEPR